MLMNCYASDEEAGEQPGDEANHSGHAGVNPLFSLAPLLTLYADVC
jgi:hypothetical protein